MLLEDIPTSYATINQDLVEKTLQTPDKFGKFIYEKEGIDTDANKVGEAFGTSFEFTSDTLPRPDKLIVIDLYGVEVALFFTPEGCDYYMHTMHGAENDYYKQALCGNTQALAFNYTKDGEAVCIGAIFPSPPDGGLLAHECQHLVDYLCEDIGIDLCMETMEPRAYMLHYLFDKITEAIAEWQEEYPEWPNST